MFMERIIHDTDMNEIFMNFGYQSPDWKINITAQKLQHVINSSFQKIYEFSRFELGVKAYHHTKSYSISNFQIFREEQSLV